MPKIHNSVGLPNLIIRFVAPLFLTFEKKIHISQKNIFFRIYYCLAYFQIFEPQSKISQNANFEPQRNIFFNFVLTLYMGREWISFVGEIAEFWENMKYQIWILPPAPFFFNFQMAAKRIIKFGRPYYYYYYFVILGDLKLSWKFSKC